MIDTARLNLLITFLGGIFILIGTIFSENISNYFFPPNELTYEVIAHSEIDDLTILNLSIVNGGQKVQKDVSIEISKSTKAPNSKGLIAYESNKDIIAKEGKSKYIFSIENLKIDERLNLSLVLNEPYLFYNEYYGGLRDVKIISDENVAQQVTKNSYFEDIKTAIFWIALVGFILLIILGFILEFILTPEQKIKMLKDNIKNNQDKIKKLKP